METWQVRVCPPKRRAAGQYEFALAWKWDCNLEIQRIFPSAQAQYQRFKPVWMNEATFAAAGTCCKSRFFSEQSARATKSPNVNLKTKPSLLLNMAGMTINERSFTVRVSPNCIVCQTRWRTRKTPVNGVERAKRSAKPQHHLECSGTWGNNGA